MIKTQISKVKISDLLELQNISKQTFSETFSEHNTIENIDKYLTEELSLSKLETEITNTNSEFYFAKLENNIIGYLKINSGQAMTEILRNNCLEIERIYVLKKYHGKNIGFALYEKAIEIAKSRNVEFIWLGVWEKNLRAIQFYKKIGFLEFSKHIFKLGDDVQVDIMMKLLITSHA